MNLEFFIARLSANAKALENLCRELANEQIVWRQTPENWSIEQVVYHLSKTEALDFRPRLEKTLRDPREAWTPISAAEMRLERNAADGENKLCEYLRNFLAEREISTAWLQTVAAPEWENSHRHNEDLTLTAGDLLASWLAHDYLHLKQITRLQYDFVSSISKSVKTAYAGEWT